jgi:GT2 family glycosyltransferase
VTALIAVVLNWNGGADTLRCLESLAEVDTIVVDNGSTDGSDIEVERRFPDLELIRAGTNLGYAGGNNLGLSRAFERGAAWTLLVNNDAWIDRGLPAALATAAAQRPDAGVLACKVYSAEQPNVLTYAGGNVRLRCGYNGRQAGAGEQDEGQYDVLRDVRRATGAAMAVSRAAVERCGLLDEKLFAYVEDVEWCVRIRSAGFAVVFAPDAKVWHRGAASTGGAASTVNLYYTTRNTIHVCEQHAALPAGLRGARRGIVLGTHLLRALSNPNRREALGTVLAGWQDARRGCVGPRDQAGGATAETAPAQATPALTS